MVCLQCPREEGPGKTQETGRLLGHENICPREPASVDPERGPSSLKTDSKERLSVQYSLEQEQPSRTRSCEDWGRKDLRQPNPCELLGPGRAMSEDSTHLPQEISKSGCQGCVGHLGKPLEPGPCGRFPHGMAGRDQPEKERVQT